MAGRTRTAREPSAKAGRIGHVFSCRHAKRALRSSVPHHVFLIQEGKVPLPDSWRRRDRLRDASGRVVDRLDAQDGARRLVGREVQQPVRPLAHVAEALLELGQQGAVASPLRTAGLAEDDTV